MTVLTAVGIGSASGLLIMGGWVFCVHRFFHGHWRVWDNSYRERDLP